jgi:hypothetical protein
VSHVVVPVDVILDISAYLLFALLSLTPQELILLLNVVLGHGDFPTPTGQLFVLKLCYFREAYS